MTTLAFHMLRSVEIGGERAGVQQLNRMMAEIRLCRPLLAAEDREYADALLLKLDHLRRDQLVAAHDRIDPIATDVPREVIERGDHSMQEAA